MFKVEWTGFEDYYDENSEMNWILYENIKHLDVVRKYMSEH
jgi:hypothetical protein